jgi:hypothetical protein
MSAGSVSLTSAINVCRVGSGEAARLESDRFLNPHNMVCPVWNGMNLVGQDVCPDSFMTKSAGCNSAMDRVLVESNLRPDYASYITLNMAGLKGEIFGNPSARAQVDERHKMLKGIEGSIPNYGKQFEAVRRSEGSCTVNAYERAMKAEQERKNVAMSNYARASENSKCGGAYY